MTQAGTLGALLLAAATPSFASAELSVDLDKNGVPEIATVTGDAGGDLALTLATPEGQTLARSDNFTWPGQPNEGPILSTNSAGSLLVKTSNFGIGRHKWELTVTVAHRNGRYVVAGVTYADLDTFQEFPAHECDFNFLSGRGSTMKAGRIRTATSARGGIPFDVWNAGAIVSYCRLD